MIEDEKKQLEIGKLQFEIGEDEKQVAIQRENIARSKRGPDSDAKKTALEIMSRELELEEKKLAGKRQALKALRGN